MTNMIGVVAVAALTACGTAPPPNDHGHLPADEIGRQSRQPIWLIVRPAILDGDVLAFDESSVVETLPERIKDVFEPGSRRGPEKSDHRHRRLLRARRERPRRRRTAEQRDELAPFHCRMPPVLPTERIAHLGAAGDCCAAGFQSGLCRLRVIQRKSL